MYQPLVYILKWKPETRKKWVKCFQRGIVKFTPQSNYNEISDGMYLSLTECIYIIGKKLF